VSNGTVTCADNGQGSFTSTFSGGTGTYTFTAIANTEANAISAVNGFSGTRYAVTGNTYNWTNISNGTWWVAVKDSSGSTAFDSVVVNCPTPTPTPTVTPTPTATPTVTPTPTRTPTPTPTVVSYSFCMGYNASNCGLACDDYQNCGPF
jgi:hypothetical protein